jgi:uncharacterized protein (TIGR02145 family)
MKKILPVLSLIFFSLLAFGQAGVVGASFTASDGTHYVGFDSLMIRNLEPDREGDTLLRYPDTAIIFGYTGIGGPGAADGGMRIWQNYPPASGGNTVVRVLLPDAGRIELRLIGLSGVLEGMWSGNLPSGVHAFGIFGAGPSWHILSAKHNGHTVTARVYGGSQAGAGLAGILHLGGESAPLGLKIAAAPDGNFQFKPGDSLLYIGYRDTLQAGIYDRPDSNRVFTFRFGYGLPCMDQSTVEYEGITYHTVQIFNQCWLKENLNVGVMIAGSASSSDNGIIEKYCYGDVEDSCRSLGAFFLWNVMMAYVATPGSRGICPAGWHVPTDNDWKLLEGVSDSLYRLGSAEWDSSGVRGVTAGYSLKSPWYWQNDGNGSDIFGFTVLPSGYRDSWGYIFGFGHASTLWCADEKDAVYAWTRGFGCHGREVSRFDMEKTGGYSVRCIRD